jgi:hypothetical protein
MSAVDKLVQTIMKHMQTESMQETAAILFETFEIRMATVIFFRHRTRTTFNKLKQLSHLMSAYSQLSHAKINHI